MNLKIVYYSTYSGFGYANPSIALLALKSARGVL